MVGELPIQVASAGSGPPLLYLHGAFGYLSWPEFLSDLSERFTVYAPLHPGFGESGEAEDFDDLLDLTLYHLDLLNALDLERPDVVGHFFGAMMAAELAAIAGNRVNRLVLSAPMGLWLEDHPGIDYFAAAPDKLRSILFADADCDAAMAALPDPDSDEQRHLQRIERTRSLATIAKFVWPIPDKGLKKRPAPNNQSDAGIGGREGPVGRPGLRRRVRGPNPGCGVRDDFRRRPPLPSRATGRIPGTSGEIPGPLSRGAGRAAVRAGPAQGAQVSEPAPGMDPEDGRVGSECLLRFGAIGRRQRSSGRARCRTRQAARR